MERVRASSLLAVFFLIFMACFCQGQTLFEQGLKEFGQENYEEALPFFLESWSADKGSARTAYYIGLTYKVMEKYPEALPYLREAASLTPRVDEGVVELVDVLYHTNNIVEAEKWIAFADKEGISTARLHFLKGMVLTKRGRLDEAVLAFETAKKLDPRLTQQAELQIAGIYTQQGRYKDAQERLRTTITLDPASDLALYARDYEKIVADKAERERPWRFSVGMGYKYDTNVVTKGDGPMVESISGQEDSAFNFGARIGYTAPFSFRTPFSFSACTTPVYADGYSERPTRALTGARAT